MIHKSRPKSFKPEDLYIICMVSNPMRYESRYDLYEKFHQHVRQNTDNIWTVEIATGERSHQVTSRSNPQHIQLASSIEGSVVWSKESAWNIAVARLPPEACYLCFLDADIQFANQDWIVETIHQLQHFKIVQPFESSINLGPTGGYLDGWRSFGYAVQHGLPIDSQTTGLASGSFYHPGFGLAIRRETFSELGGWMTWGILGAGDHHQMLALVNRVDESYPESIHPNYKALCLEWQHRANRHVRQLVGCTPGTILHHFHGSFKKRRYRSRWSILLKHQYDPMRDIKHDHQGLMQLTHEGMRMYSDLLRYYMERDEDSPVVE